MRAADRTPLLSEIVITLLFIILLCAPMLDAAYGGIFSYADEAIAILLVLWALLSRCGEKVGVHERRGLVAVGLLCTLGLVGNLVFGYQGSAFAIAVDLFTCTKIFVAYFAARIVLRGKGRCLRAFQTIGKIFFVAAACGLLLHVAGVVQLGSGRVTFGIPCYQFIFSHPTNLAAYCVGFSALMFAGKKPKNGWLVLACLILVSTQRAKAVAMAFVILFFIFYGVMKRDDGKPSKLVFVFLGAGAVFLGMDQIQEYFLTSTAARSLLMQDSLTIAGQLFPLGSGFATFGTYMSGEYYSPLYYEYGLNTVWGLWPSNPTFVSDSFWPAILAQFGFIGLVVLVYLLVETGKSIAGDAGAKGIRFAAFGTVPIYLLILSTSDASFFNFYGPFYALTIAAIVSHDKHEEHLKSVSTGNSSARIGNRGDK